MSRVVARYPGKKIQRVGTRKKKRRGGGEGGEIKKKKKGKKIEKIQFSALSSAYRIHSTRREEKKKKIGIFKFGMAIFYEGGVIKRKFCLAPIIT